MLEGAGIGKRMPPAQLGGFSEVNERDTTEVPGPHLRYFPSDYQPTLHDLRHCQKILAHAPFPRGPEVFR